VIVSDAHEIHPRLGASRCAGFFFFVVGESVTMLSRIG
jgi:hypothetical protein